MPAPMGRDKGQGTVVRTKTPKGADRWRVAVTMADGRRVWRTATTPRAAERIRRKLVEARELDLDPTRQTLGEYLRAWLAGIEARGTVRPGTIETYRSVVNHHLVPRLGRTKMAALSVRSLQAWLDAEPGAAHSRRLYASVLRAALSSAVRQRLLPYNPAALLDLPAPRSDRVNPLTLAEARALLEKTRTDRLHALWRLAIVTGLRQSELLGLTWDDWDGSALTIRGQLQRVGGRWVTADPKAARKLDRVAVDAGTAAVLDEHRRTMAAERTPAWRFHGLVFVTPEGEPWHSSRILREFHAACDRAGIPRRRFHDLRGTTATLMHNIGVAEDVRMARLGHSSADMARHYAKASTDQDRAAVDLLASSLADVG